MPTAWKTIEKSSPFLNENNGQPKKCPFRKTYYPYANINNPYIVPLKEAEYIEEDFQYCLKEECMFYNSLIGSCRHS